MSREKLYGVHPVMEALGGERRRIAKVWLDAQRHGPDARLIATLAAQRGIPVETVTGAQLRRLLGHSHHQGVVALVSPLLYQPLVDVMARLAAIRGQQTVILLDGVTDVGNFAALIRSAVAFGVETILLPRRRAVSLTPTVAKRSAGAVDRVSVVQVGNVVRVLDELKGADFWIYGADMAAETFVGQMTWPERIVLVRGGEERGLRRLVRERCDDLVRIPMQAGVDSLNVAVAGAIILAYIWDQRTGSDGTLKGQETAS
jgi:23S rRNA (guanosine2251-2'-O)-methyltransferase